jgi:hypothetical protein
MTTRIGLLSVESGSAARRAMTDERRRIAERAAARLAGG